MAMQHAKNELLALLWDRRFCARRAVDAGPLRRGEPADRPLGRRFAPERRKNLLTADFHPAAASPGDPSASRVRFDRSCGEDLAAFWKYLPDATNCRLAIHCGMSQSYAINERVPGDQTIPEWMDNALASKGTRVFGLAAPNICNEEVLFLLLATLSDPKTRPAAFIFGTCFDKFRNVDLRPGYLRFWKPTRSCADNGPTWPSVAGNTTRWPRRRWTRRSNRSPSGADRPQRRPMPGCATSWLAGCRPWRCAGS